LKCINTAGTKRSSFWMFQTLGIWRNGGLERQRQLVWFPDPQSRHLANIYVQQASRASLVSHMVKNLPAMQDTWVCPWRRECYPLQYSCLENSMDRGAWWSIVHGLALCIRWLNYWSFSFRISPSSEYSGLIALRIDWFDLLAVQGTLKSLLQHHSSKASILQCSAFFMVQLSHPYTTTRKTIALTRCQHFVGKVVVLLNYQ